jgi:hypothetical protein
MLAGCIAGDRAVVLEVRFQDRLGDPLAVLVRVRMSRLAAVELDDERRVDLGRRRIIKKK